MASTNAPSRLLPLAEELLDNRYARENLREGAEKLPCGRFASACCGQTCASRCSARPRH